MLAFFRPFLRKIKFCGSIRILSTGVSLSFLLIGELHPSKWGYNFACIYLSSISSKLITPTNSENRSSFRLYTRCFFCVMILNVGVCRSRESPAMPQRILYLHGSIFYLKNLRSILWFHIRHTSSLIASSLTQFFPRKTHRGRSLRNDLPLAVFHFHSFLHRFPGIDSVKVRHSDNVSRKGLSVGYGFTWYTVVSFEQVEKMTCMATEKGFHSVLFYSLVLSSSPPFLFLNNYRIFNFKKCASASGDEWLSSFHTVSNQPLVVIAFFW